jgi:hypothetical protein
MLYTCRSQGISEERGELKRTPFNDPEVMSD